MASVSVWSIPELVDMDPKDCKGNVDVVCNVFRVTQEYVAPYIRHEYSISEPERKAFEDDEFTLDNHWVRCDFMQRLGLNYPDPGKTTGGRHVHIIESVNRQIKQPSEKNHTQPAASTEKKP